MPIQSDTNEIVFAWDGFHRLRVLVFTGLDRRTGTLSSPGSRISPNAVRRIRIFVEDTVSGLRFAPYTQTVLLGRPDWQGLLMTAQGAAMALASQRPKCARCSSEMVLSETPTGSQHWRCGGDGCPRRRPLLKKDMSGFLPLNVRRQAQPSGNQAGAPAVITQPVSPEVANA
ncbi:MAG: hypothetical protein ACREDR_08195 [Blastocatellia bacterium]